jgi:hypothetical protein
MFKPNSGDTENPVLDQDGKPVLSQDSAEEAGSKIPNPQKKEEADKKAKADDAFKLREERRRWKAELEKAKQVNLTEADLDAAMDLAQKKGFNLDDKEGKSREQVSLMVETSDLIEKRKSERSKQAEVKILGDASRGNLTETLINLGYEKGSPEFRNAGTLLFNHFGVSDPDTFLDEGKMMSVIEGYANRLIPKKKSNDIDEALMNKGAGRTSSDESRTPGRSSGQSAEVRRLMERHGISENTAVEMIEKRKKLPIFAR